MDGETDRAALTLHREPPRPLTATAPHSACELLSHTHTQPLHTHGCLHTLGCPCECVCPTPGTHSCATPRCALTLAWVHTPPHIPGTRNACGTHRCTMPYARTHQCMQCQGCVHTLRIHTQRDVHTHTPHRQVHSNTHMSRTQDHTHGHAHTDIHMYERTQRHTGVHTDTPVYVQIHTQRCTHTFPRPPTVPPRSGPGPSRRVRDPAVPRRVRAGPGTEP